MSYLDLVNQAVVITSPSMEGKVKCKLEKIHDMCKIMVVECSNSHIKNYTQLFTFGLRVRIVAS